MLKYLIVTINLLFSFEVFSLMAAPGGCFSNSCQANVGYYGRPYGTLPPFYPYPGIPFHAVYGPTNYYYRPHGPSPYRPPNCVQCMMRYRQFQQPYLGPGTMRASFVEIPLRK